MTDVDIINVLIADDHKLFRRGIIQLLKEHPGINIVDEAQNGEELCDKYFKSLPDVALVDISMPKLSGTAAVKKIREKQKDAKILFLSMYDDEEYVYSCLVSGGLGLVNKNIMENELVHAIRAVNSGKKYFGRKYDDEKLEELVSKYESVYIKDQAVAYTPLTSREKEVLRMVGNGFTSSEIANELSISLKTVNTHRSNIITKLNLKSLSELIRYAVQYTIKDNI